MVPCPCTDGFDIRNHHQRIGRRFDKYSLRVGPSCPFQRIQVIRIHVRSRNAELGHNPLQRPIRATIQIQRYNQMVPLTEQSKIV